MTDAYNVTYTAEATLDTMTVTATVGEVSLTLTAPVEGATNEEHVNWIVENAAHVIDAGLDALIEEAEKRVASNV
jgi:predicted metallo-beta-lactamase superfamily hydrolase